MKRLPAVFYRSESGKEPVRDWLRDLSKNDRRLIGGDIRLVEFGWPVGMPVCRPLGGGLFEIRTDLPSRGIARVIFAIKDEEMVLLHGFKKKARKTPHSDLKLSRSRKRAWEQK